MNYLYVYKGIRNLVFRILRDEGISREKYENYYQIMRKDFTKKFQLIEDNSFLQNDENFRKLEERNFMFSTGSDVFNGYVYKDKIYSMGESFKREDVKQIWIKKEV